MVVFISEIELRSSCTFELIDITARVKSAVAKSRMKNGVAVITSQHTTASIVVNESEEGFFTDFKTALEKLAPRTVAYKHNFAHRASPACEPENGHSHVLASLIGCSQTLPIVNGKLKLGQWQSVFLVELDCARPRVVTITVIGE
ncbi:MAG: secondary thiamine-phosphate synthase enzyme YjbQ [Candidatus Micrarchaeota archaeon]